MKRVFVPLFILLSFLAASITYAQEIPPPSEQTYIHNACLEGGFFEGKCDFPTEAEDEWAWACGFYYAMYKRGEITLAQAPDWCKFSIPARLPGAPGFELCVSLGDEFNPISYLLVGESGQADNVVTYYESNSCEGATTGAVMMWVNLDADPGEDYFLDDGYLTWACEAYSTAYPWSGVSLPFMEQPLPGFTYFCF